MSALRASQDGSTGLNSGRPTEMMMRKFIWAVGGVCAAAAGFLVWQKKTQPVSVLAEQLEQAWHDHHTRA